MSETDQGKFRVLQTDDKAQVCFNMAIRTTVERPFMAMEATSQNSRCGGGVL